MKKASFMRSVAGMLLAALGVMTLCACGQTKESGLDKMYATTTVGIMDSLNWYNNDNYTLELNKDGVYQLIFHSDYFGAEDKESRGGITSVFIGKYSSVPSKDEEIAHLDVKLEAAERIIHEVHGKMGMAYGGNIYIDTANWTDAMTAIYDKENGEKGAEEFLADFAKEITITVEDPSLDPEDTTLVYRLTEIPDLAVVLELTRTE